MLIPLCFWWLPHQYNPALPAHLVHYSIVMVLHNFLVDSQNRLYFATLVHYVVMTVLHYFLIGSQNWFYFIPA